MTPCGHKLTPWDRRCDPIPENVFQKTCPNGVTAGSQWSPHHVTVRPHGVTFAKKASNSRLAVVTPWGRKGHHAVTKGSTWAHFTTPWGHFCCLETPNLGTRTDEIETEIIHSRSQPRYIPRNFLQIHKEEMDRPRTSNSPPRHQAT